MSYYGKWDDLKNDLIEKYGEDYIGYRDDRIYPMCELDDELKNLTPSDIFNEVSRAYRHNHQLDNFDCNAEYFYYDGYGHLVSMYDYDKFDYLNDIISNDEDAFKDWCISNNYFDEEEEEEEEEEE